MEREEEHVTLYFDEDIADDMIEGGENDEIYPRISDSLYYALKKCEHAYEVHIENDHYSLTFIERKGMPIEKAIGEILTTICAHHPTLKVAILHS